MITLSLFMVTCVLMSTSNGGHDYGEVRMEILRPSIWTTIVIDSERNVYDKLTIAFDNQQAQLQITVIAFYDINRLFQGRKPPWGFPIFLRNRQLCTFDLSTNPPTIIFSSGGRASYQFEGNYLRVDLPADLFPESGRMKLTMKRLK